MGLFDVDGMGSRFALDGAMTPDMARAWRAQTLSSLLANLGGALATQRGFGPALATGAQNYYTAQAAMEDRLLRQLMQANQMRQMGEQRAAARSLAGTAPPPGVLPEQRRAYVTLDPAAAMKMAIAARPRVIPGVMPAYGRGVEKGQADPTGARDGEWMPGEPGLSAQRLGHTTRWDNVASAQAMSGSHRFEPNPAVAASRTDILGGMGSGDSDDRPAPKVSDGAPLPAPTPRSYRWDGKKLVPVE